jgi:hypothetical protein
MTDNKPTDFDDAICDGIPGGRGVHPDRCCRAVVMSAQPIESKP